MDRLRLAWVAGFINGDGSLGIYHFKTKRQWEHRPRVALVNSEKELVNEVAAVLGGTVRVRVHKGKMNGPLRVTKNLYAWQVTCRKAYAAAKMLYPFLKGRKKRIALDIINYYENAPKKRMRLRDG